MLTDGQIADAVADLYEYTSGAVHWDHLERPKDDDGIRWGLRRIDDVDLIVMRGSTTLRDWVRDFLWVANPISHRKLGPIHPGFYDGLEEAYAVMRPMMRQNVVITGHSLGAARATILTGMMVLDKRPPIRRVTFGEPRAGFKQLHDLVAPVTTACYRNLHDLIAHLPFSGLVEHYVDAATPIDIEVAPHGAALAWGPFAWHHMMLYREGTNAVGQK